MLRTPFNSSKQLNSNSRNLSENVYGNVKVIRNNNYQWGVEDLEGNVIVPYGKYEWIDGFDNGLARVRTAGQISYTNNIEELYVGVGSGNVETITNQGEIHQRILKDREKRSETFAKWGIINRKGEEVLPVEYDEIWKFLGKNLSSTKVVKDGVESIVYFDKLNPQPNYTDESGSSSPIIKGRRCYQPNHRNQNYRRHDYLKEETWWTMTDGMYGDYPGHVDDYDFLGF